MNTKLLNQFFVLIIIYGEYAICVEVSTIKSEVDKIYLERINLGHTCKNDGTIIPCFVPARNIICDSNVEKKLEICYKITQTLEMKKMTVDEDAIDTIDISAGMGQILSCSAIKVKIPNGNLSWEKALMCPVIVDNKIISQYYVSLDSRYFLSGYNLFGYIPENALTILDSNGTFKLDSYITNIRL